MRADLPGYSVGRGERHAREAEQVRALCLPQLEGVGHAVEYPR